MHADIYTNMFVLSFSHKYIPTYTHKIPNTIPITYIKYKILKTCVHIVIHTYI